MSSNNKKLLDKIVGSFVDAMTEKLSRRNFTMRTPESKVKNIHTFHYKKEQRVFQLPTSQTAFGTFE